MASFAERIGHRAARTVVQTKSLDDHTRTALWNAAVGIESVLHGMERQTGGTQHKVFLTAVWTAEFKRPIDERPVNSAVWRGIKTVLLQGHWADALDLLEGMAKHLDSGSQRVRAANERYIEAINRVLEEFIVGYRFINGQIAELDSSAEVESIEGALDDSEVVAGAHHHLQRAVDLFADRAAPDYPNSIKESISAVEAIVRKVTHEQTLGAGLKKLESAGVSIHPALKGAWSQMYGWTSDDDGIRHGSIEAAGADQPLAKYVLVTCSAFVSYLVEQGRRAGLLS